MTRNEVILEGLKVRLENIDFIAHQLSEVPHEKRSYKEFYHEISFFTHFIIENEELKKLLVELLSYDNKLKENHDYTQAIDKINSVVRSISEKMLQRKDYQKFKKKYNIGFSNPLGYPIALEIEDLLNKFKEFNINSIPRLEKVLDSTLQVLLDILNKWTSINKDGFEIIYDEINQLGSYINSITYFEKYEHDFIGVQSAKNIATIYRSMNPRIGFQGGYTGRIDNSLIQNGKGFFSGDTLKTLQIDCKKIFYYLKERISMQLSIETSIDRFVTFMSLYWDEPISGDNPEKRLQKKFEEFIFKEGYYPISEAQFKDGRIDTLVFTGNNSFLCEFKQVDLGSVKESKKGFEDKIKGAQIQSSIYIVRLGDLQQLEKIVFIIVFTNKRITYKNNLDRIEKDGILFIVKTVSIYEKTPSKVKKDFELDIDSIIN